MTDVFIDPAQLDTVAQLLRRAQSEVAELAGTVSAACCCEVPPSLGYLDTELGAVSSTGTDAAGGYAWAAADAAGRAAIITADQSLTGAMSAAYGGTATYGGTAAYGGTATASSAASGGPADEAAAWTGVSSNWGADMDAANVAASRPTSWSVPVAAPIVGSGVQNMFGTALFNGTFGGQTHYTSGDLSGSSAGLLGYSPVVHRSADPDYATHGALSIDFAGQAGSV